MKKTLLLLLLLPALLLGQDDFYILRDAVPGGNNPGLVITIFTEQPRTVLDTTDYRIQHGQIVPVTHEVLTGWCLSPLDSAGVRHGATGRFWVNWSRADTVRFVGDIPADREVILIERFVAGQFRAGALTDSLVRADSLWRIDPGL